MMAEIIIHRKRDYFNFFRNYEVWLNEEKVGEILPNKSFTLKTDAGEHNVKFKIDWCSSQIYQLQLTENERKVIQLKSFKASTYILIYFIIINLLAIFLTTNEMIMFQNPILLILLIIGLIPLLYYLTIGRNHYLEVVES